MPDGLCGLVTRRQEVLLCTAESEAPACCAEWARRSRRSRRLRPRPTACAGC